MSTPEGVRKPSAGEGEKLDVCKLREGLRPKNR
jgi:hypothetical protein